MSQVVHIGFGTIAKNRVQGNEADTMEAVGVLQDTAAARLARIFTGATPMRIPVRMMRANEASEPTVIEFGTSKEVIFRTASELNFDEAVRLKNDDGSLDVLVRIVAVQWSEAKQAVAARFVKPVANWIIKA